MIFTKRLSNSKDFPLGDNEIEGKTYAYLSTEMSFSGSFKPATNSLGDKASKTYYIFRQTFNFNNGCGSRVMQKSFDIMIVPVLSYGAEIWACPAWRRQEMRNTKQYTCLFNTRHPCVKFQSKMCRNALGMNKNVPDHLVNTEMGVLLMMAFFIERIFWYWQHVLASFEKKNLIIKAIHASIPEISIQYIWYTSLSILMDWNEKSIALFRGEGLPAMFRYETPNI